MGNKAVQSWFNTLLVIGAFPKVILAFLRSHLSMQAGIFPVRLFSFWIAKIYKCLMNCESFDEIDSRLRGNDSKIGSSCECRVGNDGRSFYLFANRFIRIVAVGSVFLLLLAGSLYAADTPSPESQVSEKIPRIKEKVSVSTAMILDLAPGGGHFYLGNYGYGATFGLLKVGAAASTWYFYSDWQNSKTKYRRASSDQAVSYKLQSDRAAQRMTFSIIGCIVIQAASWLKVYSDCQDRNADSYPVFDVGFRDDKIYGSPSMIFIGMSRRF
jgi:hypothetical protein